MLKNIQELPVRKSVDLSRRTVGDVHQDELLGEDRRVVKTVCDSIANARLTRERERWTT